MVDKADLFTSQIKEACKLSGAAWAVWLVRRGNQWEIFPPEGISRSRRASLLQMIRQLNVSDWLAGSLSSGRIRSRKLGDGNKVLGCQQLYIFPNPGAKAILLVGSNNLDKNQRDLYQILAMACPLDLNYPDNQSGVTELFPSIRYEPGTSFELDQILDLVLGVMVEMVRCDAAYLAIRSGDLFRIEAIWKCPPELKWQDLPEWSANELVNDTQIFSGLIQEVREMDVPTASISRYISKPLHSLMKIPIVAGSRMIGEMIFVSAASNGFTQADMKRASKYLSSIAHAIENAIIFADAGRYLKQMALLNELAMAASGGVDTDEVARRVVRRLRRIFDTEQAIVLLLAKDGRTLLEYGGGIEDSPPLVIPVEKSLAGYVIEQMKPVRLGDIREAPRFYPPSPEVHSALIVPLMYRGGIIGTICLQSNLANAFTDRDEQLLVVIASHLAGLFENVRLNQAARERAGKLSLIHQVAQRVVGLADEAEIARVTAELTADYFKYELAVVLLADEAGDKLTAVGVGGSMASHLPQDFTYPVTRGITGQVFRQGKGGYFNEVSLNEVYFPLPGWEAGSEMCVPLRDGELIFGVINVERAQRHTFTESDLQLLESLAGILSSVILSARRYSELQKRIEAQRLAENRLIRSARLAAVGEMAAGIAHELNNPLTSVIGFVELVLEDLPKDSPDYADLELAMREAQRAREVVRRLLDFSRQSGNLFVHSDLNELLKEVLQLMQHQMETRGIQIVLAMNELPFVQINPNQIKQVALNLLQNALQAMPMGGTLTLRTGIDDKNRERKVYFAISDTGEGIPPDHYERIFEPFFTTRPVGEGTGLGLSVSYGIITSHGGHIDVVSEVGRGSCFTVWLPAQ